MDDDAIRINRTNGVTSWRAGCGESRTSGSGGGPEKPTDRNVGRALRSDPYTYVPFKKGFWYLVAIMDWHSRKVLSWRLSNTMTSDFCVAALHEALALYGTPEIFNTDQGSQFTSEAFTSVVKDADVKISMDGVGRAIDNVFIERLWRTLKYDHFYLNPAINGNACRDGIGDYLNYYNSERPHSSLDDQTPDEVYYQSRINQRAA
jgi:putative transposase